MTMGVPGIFSPLSANFTPLLLSNDNIDSLSLFSKLLLGGRDSRGRYSLEFCLLISPRRLVVTACFSSPSISLLRFRSTTFVLILTGGLFETCNDCPVKSFSSHCLILSSEVCLRREVGVEPLDDCTFGVELSSTEGSATSAAAAAQSTWDDSGTGLLLIPPSEPSRLTLSHSFSAFDLVPH